MAGPLTSDAGRAADPNRWAVLALLGTAQLMVVLDATIVNIALPSAQKALHFSTADREWIVTAYALAFGSLLLLGGKLGDLFGRKWTFIAGLSGFAIVSAIGGLAQNFDTLVSARALQGVFGALLAPSALGLLTVTFAGSPDRAESVRNFRGHRGRRGVGRSRSRRGADPVPLLALVPVRQPGDRGADRDLRAAAPGQPHAIPSRPASTYLACSPHRRGLFALVYGFSNAETQSWTATATIVALVASPVLLITFVVIESRVKNPLLPLHIVRNRARGGAYLSVLLTSAGVFGVFFFLTYYMQLTLGFSPLTAGLAFLPLTGRAGGHLGHGADPGAAAHRRQAARDDRDDARGDRDDHLHPADSRRYLRHPRPPRAARHRPGHGVHLRARDRNRDPRRRGPRDRRGLGNGQHLPAGRRRRRAGAAEHASRRAPPPTTPAPTPAFPGWPAPRPSMATRPVSGGGRHLRHRPRCWRW